MSTATVPNSEPRVMEVLLSDIAVDDKNARQRFDEKKIADLADSMVLPTGKRNMINAVVLVETPKGPKKFRLRAGTRRFMAATRLKWDTITAKVHPSETPQDVLAFNGLIENLQREDLTPYETATGFRTVCVDFNLNGSQAAKRAGKSPAHVNNLLRILEHVAPHVLDQWKMGHPLATTDTLNKLAAMKLPAAKGEDAAPDHDAQLKAWAVLTGGAPAPAANGAGAPAGGGTAPAGAAKSKARRNLQKNADALIDFYRAKEKANAMTAVFERDFALVRFLTGARKAPPDGIELAAPAPKAAARKGHKGRAGRKAAAKK